MSCQYISLHLMSMVVVPALTFWPSLTATVHHWWTNIVETTCQWTWQARATLWNFFSTRMMIFIQDLVGASAGLQWHRVTEFFILYSKTILGKKFRKFRLTHFWPCRPFLLFFGCFKPFDPFGIFQKISQFIWNTSLIATTTTTTWYILPPSSGS